MSMYVCIVQLYVHALCNLMSMHCATWCPCIVQLDVHALCNFMSMHCTRLWLYCATWCPCIVQLDVHALCNLMSMHCTRLCIVQLDVHALCNFMSMHCTRLWLYCATWWPCTVQLDVHALCNLMSMHCATRSIYGKLGKTKSTCCPYIMQPDSQSYVHVFMYCATLCPCIMQLDVHALCNLMSMHCATLSIYRKVGKTKSTKSCCPYIMQPDSQSYVHVFMYCATLCQLDVHVLCNLMSMHCATLCHNTWRSCCTIHGHNLHNTWT